jgi:hypothetical protein
VYARESLPESFCQFLQNLFFGRVFAKEGLHELLPESFCQRVPTRTFLPDRLCLKVSRKLLPNVFAGLSPSESLANKTVFRPEPILYFLFPLSVNMKSVNWNQISKQSRNSTATSVLIFNNVKQVGKLIQIFNFSYFKFF